MLGIPERVSETVLMIFTNRESLCAYSVRYNAVNTPIGSANNSDKATMMIVLMIELTIDRFSLV